MYSAKQTSIWRFSIYKNENFQWNYVFREETTEDEINWVLSQLQNVSSFDKVVDTLKEHFWDFEDEEDTLLDLDEDLDIEEEKSFEKIIAENFTSGEIGRIEVLNKHLWRELEDFWEDKIKNIEVNWNRVYLNDENYREFDVVEENDLEGYFKEEIENKEILWDEIENYKGKMFYERTYCYEEWEEDFIFEKSYNFEFREFSDDNSFWEETSENWKTYYIFLNQ